MDAEGEPVAAPPTKSVKSKKVGLRQVLAELEKRMIAEATGLAEAAPPAKKKQKSTVVNNGGGASKQSLDAVLNEISEHWLTNGKMAILERQNKVAMESFKP
jgi:hypothetical protein